MDILDRLFGQRKMSDGKEVGKATQGGRSRAFSRFGAILIVLALLLPFLAQIVFAQPTVIATISFGASRAGVIAANPVTNRVYAAQEDFRCIAVIDGATNTILTTVPTRGYHTGIDANSNPVTNRVYVSQHFAGSVRIIDGATNSVIIDLPVPGGYPGDLAVNPATNRLYVIRSHYNDVAVFDAGTNNFLDTISLSPVGSLRGIAVNPSTNRIYVADAIGNEVIVIDGASNSVVARVPVTDAHYFGVNPDTDRIYVVSYSPDRIEVIDGASNAIVDTIPVSAPWQVGVNPDTNRIYVTSGPNQNVSVIDGDTNTVVDIVDPVGVQPGHLAVVPSTSRIYVTDDVANSVFVIEDLIDTTPPVVNVSFPSPDGQNGWFVTSPVIGSVTANDTTTGGSNVTAINCTGATVGPITGLGTPSASALLTVSAEGVNNVSCTATDSAGNSGAGAGSNNTAIVQIDKTAPSASASASPGPNANGWNNSDVTVSFSGDDGTGSGIDSCSPPVVLSSEGAGQSASGTCTDLAGNVSAPATASDINIDKTAPALSITTPEPYDVEPVGTPLDFSASDALSGLEADAVATLTGEAGTWEMASGEQPGVGIYEVVVEATDQAGNTATSEPRLLVIYDPEGGFVTGGGWIYSDPGAYVPDPTLEGKANFGFVSKYKKGATTPTGQTEFQFHLADLNFHSSSYDWLVVTGSDYARFKGSGTINGMGDYKFMLWAGDGEPATFRIKIWEEDEDGNETVTYDNGFDQEIAGGSIVVHTSKK